MHNTCGQVQQVQEGTTGVQTKLVQQVQEELNQPDVL